MYLYWDHMSQLRRYLHIHSIYSIKYLSLKQGSHEPVREIFMYSLDLLYQTAKYPFKIPLMSLK
uniref:Uncharacterized protein n=1 Tax=Octopus bimaculoides TaxID=37653 RepID=A0A0L8H0L3_OCTBM